MSTNNKSYVSAIKSDICNDNIVDMTKKYSSKYVTRADSFKKSGEYNKAVSCYLQSIMLERNNPTSYIGLGQSYKFLNNYDKAIQTFEKSLELKSNNYEAYYEMGICYILKQQPEKAIECFKQSVLIDKNQLDVQLQLALAHELVDEQYMAMMIYDKLIEEHPTYLKAHSHKAALLICQGRYKDACKIFFDILKVDEKFYRAYFGIGVCFDNLKKNADARRYYKKFLSVRPDSSHANYVKERLKALKTPSSKINDYMGLV